MTQWLNMGLLLIWLICVIIVERERSKEISRLMKRETEILNSVSHYIYELENRYGSKETTVNQELKS
jgi:hypothetical protein